ncbi:MAG: GGDEF domain-containing protein [Lachnospiraceae bacterium]
MGKRKNIALLVAMIENEFSYAVCEGAILGAKEIDANLFILPVGIIDANYDDVDANCYRYQYSTLYSCVKSKEIDAVIIEYGTVTSFMDSSKKKEFLEQLGDVPVILLAGEEDGYSSICVDNRAGLNEAILHLIDEHNCSRIGFVSGPVDTNQDARERLEVFRKTMESRNLSVGDDWIVYGNFSEFSEEVVEDLLTRHPDIEAVVFANDQMAIGGYNAMKKLGLEPGKDIFVTGFDDSPAAMLLEPHLTTVKADTKELAYRAVLESANVMKGKEVHQFVKSRLIVRESCGCGDMSVVDRAVDIMAEQMQDSMIKNLADDMFEKYFNIYFESNETLRMKKIVEDYFDYYLHLVTKDGLLEMDEEEFADRYIEFSQTYLSGYIDLNQFLSIGYILHGYLSKMIRGEQDRFRLLQAMSTVNQELMSSITKQKLVSDEKSKVFEIVLTNITRDMLQFSREEKKKYETVIKKFQRMGFPSSFIFTYGRGIVHRKGETWIQPERFFVKAYHNQDDIHLYKGKEKRIKPETVFSSKFMPVDRRFDMLVMPLFSGAEQYGLLLTESELEYFRYASQIACQVSVSIEVLEILKKQSALKKELEKNLAMTVANNKVLNEMSRSDPLTGISNRRGFLDTVKRIMEDEHNYGKKAVAVYADMDNLKIINDEFGHDEGDFSLKTIAKALTESFRQSDVVGRMGGDEFAAFAIVSHDNFAHTIKERIHSVLRDMNASCDKPFYVNMSVGTYEFIIEADSNLDHILNEADANLYIEKKHKKKVVYKER